ncbi:hypothetical protein BAUCODRAFT_503902 [Baudoinia panamericana UAMH 10762]|uniref:Uncharacterized protein n=1 Tax=Baudoinia panamericana (strain UAMH 10762) TaxID=717646 RepID=M2MW68_BAUPA|nr:uncharacterized protein BAUCODRAFT_503902 [Baudoinia panamericana UAMH 10762]EMC95793.1 hypothetical protein BAUCODRAFT_503902 [Baudoinia panamericana UAMH 10762]
MSTHSCLCGNVECGYRSLRTISGALRRADPPFIVLSAGTHIAGNIAELGLVLEIVLNYNESQSLHQDKLSYWLSHLHADIGEVFEVGGLITHASKQAISSL